VALDPYGVQMSLLPVCPLDGVGGPFQAAGTNIYPDGNGTFWRLDFSASATLAQQQSAITTLGSLASYTPPQTPSLTPYRFTGSVTFPVVLGAGTQVMSVAIPGLLRTDAPMISYATALPASVDVKSIFPDSTRDGYLMLQVAVASLLAAAVTVPFTLVGVR
jgi:hypothetical protein